MALKATIYKAGLEISDVDRGVYEEVNVTLARHPSETAERLVTRLLAYAMRFDPALEFGRGVSTPDEPDLWRRDAEGRVVEWIEVGQPDAKRIVKASRLARHVGLFAYGAGLERWWEGERRALESIDNLWVDCVPADLIAALVENLERSFRWSITLSDGVAFIDSGGKTLESSLECRLGLPPKGDG